MHDILLAGLIRRYYYPDMHARTRNSINWIIIALLVMLPLRGAIAVEPAACDMHDQASQQMHDHAMHARNQHDDRVMQDLDASSDCCCCEAAMTCGVDCGIGSSASVIAQPVIQVPLFDGADYLAEVSNDLVFREHSPPIRPPAILQI